MTTIFKREYNGRSIELRLPNDDVTWWDLADDFISFLQGCGYQVTREDFAEYFTQFLPIEDVTNEDLQ